MAVRIPLAFHGAIDLAAGLALMAAPFALGFGAAATFVTLALGALIVGLGLATTASDGRGILAPGAHAAYDLGLSIGLVGAAIVLGVAGDAIAFGVLVAAGAVGLLLTGLTRYSVSPA